jgi:uncharacterized protein (TIGR02145 family)
MQIRIVVQFLNETVMFEPTNCDIYGRLYNWETAQKVCPYGWHLPEDREWKTLTDYLGGASYYTTGGKLKKTGTKYWEKSDPETVTNETGFCAIGCGIRTELGAFACFGQFDYLWLSDFEPPSGYRKIELSSTGAARTGWTSKDWGLAVRCLKNK